MSFTENPYKNIELTKSTNGPDDHWSIHCSSCGAEIGILDEEATISVIITYNKAHLVNSHKRTEADFTGWS